MGLAMMDFFLREARAVVKGPMAVVRLGTCGCLQEHVKVGNVSVADGSALVQRNYSHFDSQSPAHAPWPSSCGMGDNVTVTVVTAVQYRIQKDMVKVAVFDIASPQAQIAAEVDSVLRSTLPTMTLDESYAAKEKMVEEILPSVREAMGRYGYDILNVLITDIQPERSVLDAMNEINASRRQREAAFEKGEADKLLKIKASEADAEAKRLAGVGMANMRAAMAQGFQDSMKFMKESGMSEKEAMHMMIMTQYLDTLKEFASSHGSIVAKPYTISELCLPDAELTSTVIAALREALGGEKVNEGTNLTADSFYSSQGRADSAFNDENSQLIGEGTMRAAACVVNVANRPTGEVVGEEALRLAESEGGKALMKALAKLQL
eukprot:g7286.t1